MDTGKSLPSLFAEWWDQRRANRRATTNEAPRSQRLARWMPNRGSVIFTLLVVVLLLWAQTAGALPLPGYLNAPDAPSTGTIAYQGRLADANGNPLTAVVNMEFRLYNTATGGTPLWSELWTGSSAVQVSDGLFNVMLGSLTPIPQNIMTGNSSLWLGITAGTDDEMMPRVQLGSVPFAVQALTVPDGSVATVKLADGSVTSTKLADDAVERRNFAPMTGIVWKAPPYIHFESSTWKPSQNQTWDISSHLTAAGVPPDAEVILIGWRPSLISDSSLFDLAASNDEILGSVRLSTNLPDLMYSAVGIEYGTPIPVPGATRKLVYRTVGGYQQEPTDNLLRRRVLIVYGWK